MSPAAYTAQEIWGLCREGTFPTWWSMVLNYVFSKLIIFKKK
ncbi:MAG: hypothetical protein ACLVJH_03890 [Faecalibacterium prausnitzii]